MLYYNILGVFNLRGAGGGNIRGEDYIPDCSSSFRPSFTVAAFNMAMWGKWYLVKIPVPKTVAWKINSAIFP